MEISEIFRLLLEGPEIETKSEIAFICNVSPQALNCWKRFPSRHCRKLEFASGGRVTRYQMRPDIFGCGPDDWSDIKNNASGCAAA